MAEEGQTISLVDLYLAYRKAKAEAFYENTHFNALAYVEYERHLERNLVRLHTRLVDPEAGWARDISCLGSFVYLPKSVDTFASSGIGRPKYRAINPFEEWKKQFHER